MKIGPGRNSKSRAALVVDRRAGHVGGHQVGRELDPAEAAARAPARTTARSASSPRPGKSSIRTWPSASSAEQDELERLALADDRALDLVEQRVRALGDLGDVHSDSTARRRGRSGPACSPGASWSRGRGRSAGRAPRPPGRGAPRRYRSARRDRRRAAAAARRRRSARSGAAGSRRRRRSRSPARPRARAWPARAGGSRSAAGRGGVEPRRPLAGQRPDRARRSRAAGRAPHREQPDVDGERRVARRTRPRSRAPASRAPPKTNVGRRIRPAPQLVAQRLERVDRLVLHGRRRSRAG